MDDVKMFLFARWLATCYEGVLNTESGYWYKEQLDHFNKVVWPNYEKNGTVKDTLEFFEKCNTDKKWKVPTVGLSNRA